MLFAAAAKDAAVGLDVFIVEGKREPTMELLLLPLPLPLIELAKSMPLLPPIVVAVVVVAADNDVVVSSNFLRLTKGEWVSGDVVDVREAACKSVVVAVAAPIGICCCCCC